MRIVDLLAHDEKLFLLANYGFEKRHWVWAKEDGVRFPFRLDGAATSQELNALNVGSHWLQVYSPLADKLLVHPRIRESREAQSVGMSAPYSKENVQWNRYAVTPFLYTDIMTQYFDLAVKYTEDVFQWVVFGWHSRSEDDVVVADFKRLWETEGKAIEDAVNKWYTDYLK